MVEQNRKGQENNQVTCTFIESRWNIVYKNWFIYLFEENTIVGFDIIDIFHERWFWKE